MKMYWQNSSYITALSPGLFTHMDYVGEFNNSKKYPYKLIKFISFLIINDKKRRRFRAKYSKV